MPTRIAASYEPIPGYRLIERLGRGGFGEVWKVEAPGGIHKAIKFVYGNLEESLESGKPAEQELKALHRVKSIRHPYILTIERFDVIDGQLCIVMELADRNLFDRFRECLEQDHKGIPRDELLRYLSEAAEALDLMNNHYQIQHLDIKPQNLFLIFNHIKIADFGLAKDMEGKQAILTGGVTPVYAAPETFEGTVSRFCDQYSLAIVFQEMLTGVRPFSGTTARQLMMQHLQAPPDVSVLDAADQEIVQRALAKSPEDRFANCSDFVNALCRQRPDSKSGRASQAAQVVARSLADPANQRPSEPPPTMDGCGLATPTLGHPSHPLPPLSDSARRKSHFGTRISANNALAQAPAAPPEQTGPGALMPALIIGIGELGMTVLHRLRRAIRDRFKHSTLPHIRFLGIDTDPEAIQAAERSSVGLEPRELFLARLFRPSHYAKYQAESGLLDSWLPPHLLYRLPRRPATTGIRAFGRLALFDHYRAMAQRIHNELSACTAPEALAEADRLTGLGLRSNRPRVVVVCGLGGGTGSGMFLDVAFAARFQLKLLGYTDPQIHAILLAPQVGRSGGNDQSVANAYAALIELVHFERSPTGYESLFDPKEGPLFDDAPPFQKCLVLELPNSRDRAALRPITSQSASVLFRELLTPLGRKIDLTRQEAMPRAGITLPFQTVGTFQLTWPRTPLWELTTWRLAVRLLRAWTERDAAHLIEPVRSSLEDQIRRRQLDPDSIMNFLRAACQTELHEDPETHMDAALADLDQASRKPHFDTACLRSGFDRVLHLIGLPGTETASGTDAKLMRVIAETIGRERATFERRVAELASSYLDMSEFRLPGAEEMLRQFSQLLRQTLERFESLAASLLHQAKDLYAGVLADLATLEKMSHGTRRATLANGTLVKMRHYARLRFEGILVYGLVRIFRTGLNYIPEFQPELQGYRLRLEATLARLAKTPTIDMESSLGPGKPVLALGAVSLEATAEQIANSQSNEQMLVLDGRIQQQIRRQHQSLAACFSNRIDESPLLVELILEQTRAFLEPQFRETSSAAVYFRNEASEQAAHRDVMQGFDEAQPQLARDRSPAITQLCLLAVPDDDAGRRFAQIAEHSLSDTHLTVVQGGDDIIFYRERRLRAADLPQLGPLAREVFEQVCRDEAGSAHSRSDIVWRSGART